MFHFHSGTYQIRMDKNYARVHLTSSTFNDDEMEFLIELCSTRDDLVLVRFQSRHSNKNFHEATVQFEVMNENSICTYYRICTPGAREVRCCVCTAVILWHFDAQRGKIDKKKRTRY